MERSTRRTLFTAAALCLCTASTAAQGADDCGNAQPIAGFGPFTYDTLTATTDGPAESFWSIPGLDTMDNDVWFSWQAPTTSVYEISNCYDTNTWPTFIAIYAFGCPAGPGRAAVARDFGCGGFAFTTLELGTQAGTTYLIRIGHSVPQNRDVGKFTIGEIAHPGILGTAVNPANGHTYHFLEPSSWTIAQAAAETLGGDLVTVNDQAENDWLDATFSSWGGQPRSFWIGYSDAETEGLWKWASGESPGYENWSSGAPNNGNQYEHYAHFRHDWTDGTWNDLLGYPRAGFFYNTVHGVVEIPDTGLGTPYCDETQNPNNVADLAIDTIDSSSSSIHLTLSNGPPGQFCYLLVGDGNGTISQPPGAEGDLCVAGGSCLGRYDKDVGGISGAGEFSMDILNAISNPCSGGVNIDPGTTWNFQYWHRQPAGQLSTFSHALSVTFQ